MVATSPSFDTLSEEFQALVQLAQEEHGITVTPLQQLGGGRSGAVLYLVRVVAGAAGEPQHLVLKLDRVHPKASSDEIERHEIVERDSPAPFSRSHIPQLAYERVEHDGALAIFYTIAGQSLRNFRTLSSLRRQHQLERLFARVNALLLDEWNPDASFSTIAHPHEMLQDWLGFRLEPGQKIEKFVREVCQLPSGSSGFLVRDQLLPNPLHYARTPQAWGSPRALDAVVGRLHGDLNSNNILTKFSGDGEIDSCYLIDFAMFKDEMPLLYDQRYLEMSFLIDSLTSIPFEAAADLLTRYSEVDILPASQAPIEMAGVNAALRAGREAFAAWVEQNHPSLHDDLWGQYWLAGAAAGLAYCHKAAMRDEMRLAGLIFAGANLKQFLRLFDLPLPTEAGQLYRAGQFGGARTQTLERVGQPQHNLPAARTRFVGRRSELQAVTDLILEPETRLVTLTGPGGTGKTRLALEIARGALDQFEHGAFFIDLSRVNEADMVAATAAHALGLREGGSEPPLQKLKDYTSQREMLLVFDNFEQVAQAAPTISELLQAAPGVKALVTSRVPLQLHGETEYPVKPLELPDETEADHDERPAEALRLFEQQAQTVQPGFEITSENRATVTEICRRLDGLPLAIELAAARVKMLPPEALLERLDRSLDLLVSPAQDLPERQRTLREAIQWSYRLLEPRERQLLLRLGVFAGGFTLDAAAAISESMDEMEVFAGVEALLNHSLIRRTDSTTGEARFDMLNSIREFARAEAAAKGEMAELRRNHCDYFLQLADHGIEGGIFGDDSVHWLRVYQQEHDNYRRALDWALGSKERLGPTLQIMAGQLAWFWYRSGYLQEGSEWMERALRATADMEGMPLRAFALAGRGSLALWSGDLNLAARTTREAMELAQRIGLEPIVAMCNMTHGIVLVNQGKDQQAYPHLVNSVEMFDEQALGYMKGTALVHLANVSLGLGDAEAAKKWLDRARPHLNASGDVWFKAFALNNYGEVARAEGDYERAGEYYRRTEALYQQADSKGDQARLLTALGYVSQHRGEPEQARALFLHSLDEFRKLGNPRGIAEAMAGLAGLAAEAGESRSAAPLLAAAEKLLHDVGGAWWPADRVEIDRTKERLRTDLGEEFDRVWAQGETLSQDEAIQRAEQEW